MIGTRKAIILNHSETITTQETGDHFRPRYAVDVELLGPDGERTGTVYEQLPVPNSWVWGLPEPGTLVRVGYDYNRVDHPYISEILTEGQEIPAEVNDEILLYSTEECKISLNRQTGKIKVFSYGEIELDGDQINISGSLNQDLVESVTSVEMDSTEEIGGTKKLEAMGNLTLSSGSSLRLVSAGNAAINSMASLDLFAAIGFQVVAGMNISFLSQLGEFTAGNQLGAVEIDALGNAKIGSLMGSVTIDAAGLTEIVSSAGNLKMIIDGIIDELSKVIVTMGTSPNVAALTILKTQLATILK